MTDLEPILTLWRDLRDSGQEYVLGTVVRVEGSGYRKPGARILIAADGRRTGTISGGCLEGELARKAFWHTEYGPVVRRYSTAAEDGEFPYGMGCGGIVDVLLERSAKAAPLLERLAVEFTQRQPLAIATALDGPSIGARAFCSHASSILTDRTGDALSEALAELAFEGFEQRQSSTRSITLPGESEVCVRVEWNAARPGLFLFGGGDDAIPLARMGRQLGWYIEVADGRLNLATRARFSEVDVVRIICEDCALPFALQDADAAVLMTHSLEQDARILDALLDTHTGYIGVLGPRHRTSELLLLTAESRAIAPGAVETTVAGWMARLHAPIGLDLGGETPADIALAVMAEIQQHLHRASGKPLSLVRSRQHQEAVASTA